MKTYLSRTWVSPKLVAGESAIHGVGVFAAEPIAAGEKLMEFGGLTLARADADPDVYRIRSMWNVGDDAILALPHSDLAPSLDENLNHSCDANAWLDGEVVLIARTAIAAGEEITLDQGTWNFDEEDYACDQDACSCGVVHCRENLMMDDWKRLDVQARYRGHFHPQIQRMIDADRR